MDEIRVIDIRESILADNSNQAGEIRRRLDDRHVFMMNVMASPGSGKTSLIIQTIRRLMDRMRIGVIEGDVESSVDAERIQAEGIPVVQIRTGGACHLDASMIALAMEDLDLAGLDMVIIENIGNLICPAEFDTGAHLKVMILSVPEGDDKVLKYPLMFLACEALVVNKTDYLDGSDFNLELLSLRAKALNKRLKIFPVSCKSGEGLEAWCEWLAGRAAGGG